MTRALSFLAPCALFATPALAATPLLHGGALDPVSAMLALGMGGAALWSARRT